MVHNYRGSMTCRAVVRPQAAGKWLALVTMLLAGGSLAPAEQPPVHYEHAGELPPGAIGSRQLERGGPLPGYFQPVEIEGPAGSSISLAVDDQFTQPSPAPLKAGMLIGSVYRIRVAGIPRHEGVEVFPTIELVNRLYPPPGQELRFPVPIELTLEDLELAMEGRFVTRVIYLEDPKLALPAAEDKNHQEWFEVGPHDDPLAVADRLGRPMAILRIGGRVPTNSEQPGAEFMYHSPPLLLLNGRECE
ncbi:MAG TPA: hypothetical protein VKB78_03330 [Pirellulales bacterium]|nr:hypothetical protein [Pirellulales bacterium]